MKTDVVVDSNDEGPHRIVRLTSHHFLGEHSCEFKQAVRPGYCIST